MLGMLTLITICLRLRSFLEPSKLDEETVDASLQHPQLSHESTSYTSTTSTNQNVVWILRT